MPGVETRVFAYNAANRMSSVSLNGEYLMGYRYNGMGERVYRSGNGDAVHTVFDPGGHWLGDYDGNGTTIQQVIWLGDLPAGLLAEKETKGVVLMKLGKSCCQCGLALAVDRGILATGL